MHPEGFRVQRLHHSPIWYQLRGNDISHETRLEREQDDIKGIGLEVAQRESSTPSP